MTAVWRPPSRKSSPVPEAGRLATDTGPVAGRPSLAQRLAAAGVPAGTPAWEAWQRLRAAEGPRTTGIDLYELAARERGLTAGELPRSERAELAGQANRAMWAGFEHLPSAVAPLGPIEVVAYDPAWPLRFTRWRERLQPVLGGAAAGVHHIGSTSVPGLPAKPIVDILVRVPDLEDEGTYVPGIESLGMAFRSRDQMHRCFRPAQGRPYEVNIHVCDRGGRFARDHLLFRDYLRDRAEARDAYATTKRDAARVWADDRWAYTEAKTGVILDLLDAAEHWAETTRWTFP